jgi:hypothetical protein
MKKSVPPVNMETTPVRDEGTVIEEKKEQKWKENIMSKECEENSKGKEHIINGHINGTNDVEEHGKKGKERVEMGVGATCGGNINEITSAGSREQSRVAQKWKRRARVGQQWPPAVQPKTQIGKSKNVGGQVDGNEEGKGIMEKRSKLNGGKELVLQDEEDELDYGSGMVGSVSQPCRLA